jgi:hypothetical protein
MMARGRAIVPHSGNEMITFDLPPYAVRYLQQMCMRERTMLDNLAASGVYNVVIDAARDALNQIERALP